MALLVAWDLHSSIGAPLSFSEPLSLLAQVLLQYFPFEYLDSGDLDFYFILFYFLLFELDS